MLNKSMSMKEKVEFTTPPRDVISNLLHCLHSYTLPSSPEDSSGRGVDAQTHTHTHNTYTHTHTHTHTHIPTAARSLHRPSSDTSKGNERILGICPRATEISFCV